MKDILIYISLYFVVGYVFAQGWYYNMRDEVRWVMNSEASVEGIRIFIFLFWWAYLLLTLYEAIKFTLKFIANIFIYLLTFDEDRMLQ